MQPGRFGADGNAPIQLSERRTAIAQVTGRKRQDAQLRAAIHGAFGLDLPRPGSSATNDSATGVWIAPETWLILRDGAQGGDLTRELATACGDAVSVVDQTWGKSIIRISGARARDVLAKGCRVDLHPRVFGPGKSAVTPIAHIHTVLTQVDPMPTFDLIVPSTLARDFVEWLRLSAAEFGYEVVA
jgi:sarcosine oxidase subunit gamma